MLQFMLFDLNKLKNLVNAIMYRLVYIAHSEWVSNRKVQPKTQTNGKVLGSEHFYDDMVTRLVARASETWDISKSLPKGACLGTGSSWTQGAMKYEHAPHQSRKLGGCM